MSLLMKTNSNRYFLFIGRARITKALHFFFPFKFYSCSVFFAEKMWEEKSKLIENLI